MRDNRGQNLIEYIMLVTAVVIVCICFFTAHGPMAQRVNASLNSIINQMDNLNGAIQLR